MPKFYMPTLLLSGKNCIKDNPEAMIMGKKCIIITGRNSAVVSGALDDVKYVLEENGIEYRIYDKITGSSNINEIYQLAQSIKSEGDEYIIGIGGGSPLDAAKAAAVYASNDIEPMQIFDEVYENDPLPVICVPTTAGTGSDTTQYVMMTIDEFENKRSFCSEKCFPKVTYLDLRYTKTLPLEVTRNTAIDALCHAVESYLNTKTSMVSDMVSLRAIKLIGKCKKALISGEITEEDRKKLILAASLGGMAISNTGLNLVHSMGYQLTCTKGIPHGRANGIFLPEFISWIARKDVIRAVNVMKTFGDDLNGMKKFIDKILPFDEEITENDIDGWVKNTSFTDVAENCPREVTIEDEREIYYNSLIDKKRDYMKW